MIDEKALTAAQTEQDYSKARSQAFWASIWDRLRGETSELLNFEEVRQRLRLNDERYLGLQDIPLDNIVGSVGRYKDFTRKFLPKGSINKDRWKAVDALALGQSGFPPIEVYKVGDAYFVLDGNHRVSVARSIGMPAIEAYVTELRTDVPFDKHTTPKDLFIKEGYARFLRETHLKTLRPDSELLLTEPGNYQAILEHIEVHRYFVGINCGCPPTWEEAVTSWYDNVYMPVVRAIRQHNMLEDFPDRTEADLYVWIIWHQEELTEHYIDPSVTLDDTVMDFIEKHVGL